MRAILVGFLAAALVTCPLPCQAIGLELDLACPSQSCCLEDGSCPVESPAGPVPSNGAEQGTPSDAPGRAAYVPPALALPPLPLTLASPALAPGGVRDPRARAHVPRFLELEVFRL